MRTALDALAWAQAREGMSRLNGTGDWWSDRNVNDCAIFASTAIWGSPVIAWVPDFTKRSSDGTFHKGKTGMRVGDLVLFDWEPNGSPNHVEICSTPPDTSGVFRTWGTNAGNPASVRERVRSAFVLGYWRPNYPGASTTAPANPTSPAPSSITTPQEENVFRFITIADKDRTTEVWLTGPRGRVHVASPADLKLIQRWLASDRLLLVEVDIVINLYISKVA